MKGHTINKKKYSYALIGLIIVILFLSSGLFKILNNKFHDSLFKARGSITPDSRIVIVSIDDISFSEIRKRWPWPRTYLAEAIDKINTNNPLAIGIDINLSDEGFNKEEDEKLKESLSKCENIILGGKFSKRTFKGLKQTFFEEPIEMFKEESKVGFVDFTSDTDGFIRKMPIKVDFNGETYLSFSSRIIDSINIKRSNKSSKIINFAGPVNTFPSIPFYKVLNGEFDTNFFKDKIVLIGSMFPESHDHYPVPFTTIKEMYGVEIHANAVNTALSNNPIIKVPKLYDFLIVLFVLVISIIVLINLKPLKGIIFLTLTFLFTLIISYYLFKYVNLQFSTVDILGALFLAYVGSIFYHYNIENKDKKRIKNYFSKYVSPSVVEKILDINSENMLGGQLEDVTIFFSDIRGFTPLTESLNPTDVVDMLNEYFDEMAEIIFKHEGTLNKFIGDAIMAIYGAPIHHDDHEVRAVLSGLEMREKLKSLNSKRVKEGNKEIKIGMGIHSGEVIIGNIGSKRQMEFTAIGDPVNACARIESLTKEYNTDFLISDRVYKKVKDIINVETLEPVFVKGKSESLTIYKVLGRKNSEKN